MSRPQGYSWAIFILAVAGILISAVSLYNHYQTGETSYCSFDETFNCDLVNRSIYSSIGGVPVALIGLLGYGMIAALSRIATRNRGVAAALLVSSLVGLGFAMYLTYVEAYVLAVWCILCLGSQAIILLITVLSALLFFAAPVERSRPVGTV
jgi:vitamin-K-epoxide reductase (warfarin-sensitive)